MVFYGIKGPPEFGAFMPLLPATQSGRELNSEDYVRAVGRSFFP